MQVRLVAVAAADATRRRDSSHWARYMCAVIRRLASRGNTIAERVMSIFCSAGSTGSPSHSQPNTAGLAGVAGDSDVHGTTVHIRTLTNVNEGSG